MMDSLLERLVVAFASAMVAGITLVVLPLALGFLSRGQSGGYELFLYQWVFSKIGLGIVVMAAITGFISGAERMAIVFSFFWGTHPFWKRLGEAMREHNDGGRLLLLFVLAVLVITIVYVRILG